MQNIYTALSHSKTTNATVCASVQGNIQALSTKTQFEITLTDSEGLPKLVTMNRCQRRRRDLNKCRVTTFALAAKVPHVDCEPVELTLSDKQIEIDGVQYEVVDFGSDCNHCTSLYVVKLKHIEIKCAETIQICRCEVVGEVGCEQAQVLRQVDEVQGNPCPTTGTESTTDDARHHRKTFRLYMSQSDALKVCGVDGVVIAKTSLGNVRITSESFEGDCPSVSGHLDLKEYEVGRD